DIADPIINRKGSQIVAEREPGICAPSIRRNRLMITEQQGIQIVKANGETDIFSADKLRQSLYRSGASEETVELVVTEVLKTLHEGMNANQIYRTAFRLLKRLSKRTAPRYSLNRAIMDMGPSGYPFEHLVAGIFRRNGYEAQVGVIRQGLCVTHEVDVL